MAGYPITVWYKMYITTTCNIYMYMYVQFEVRIHWGKADDHNCKLRSSQDGGHEIR